MYWGDFGPFLYVSTKLETVVLCSLLFHLLGNKKLARLWLPVCLHLLPWPAEGHTLNFQLMHMCKCTVRLYSPVSSLHTVLWNKNVINFSLRCRRKTDNISAKCEGSDQGNLFTGNKDTESKKVKEWGRKLRNSLLKLQKRSKLHMQDKDLLKLERTVEEWTKIW